MAKNNFFTKIISLFEKKWFKIYELSIYVNMQQ